MTRDAEFDPDMTDLDNLMPELDGHDKERFYARPEDVLPVVAFGAVRHPDGEVSLGFSVRVLGRDMQAMVPRDDLPLVARALASILRNHPESED